MVAITTDGLRDASEAGNDEAIAKWAIATGTANIIAAAYTPAVTELVDGVLLGFRALNTNTGAAIFGPDGIEALPLVRPEGALVAGNIVTDGEYFVRYNETNGNWMLLNQTWVEPA